MIERLFAAHPREAGQTYGEHLLFAWRFGAAMIAGGFAALVHGLFPFLFPSAAGNTVRRLHALLEVRRARADA